MKVAAVSISVIMIIYLLCGCSPDTNNVNMPREQKSITSDTIWASKGNYRISCDLYVKAFLAIGDSSTITVDSSVVIYIGYTTGAPMFSIGKGSTIYFAKDAGILVEPNGALIAHGNSANLITFTGSSPDNYWGTIKIDRSEYSTIQGQSSLTYCLIERATTGMVISSQTPEISNCTVRNCRNNGIFFKDDGCPRDSAFFLNNTFISNGGYPVSIQCTGVVKLSGSGNFTENGKNGIEIRDFPSNYNSGICGNNIWRKHNIPYHVAGYIKARVSSGDSPTRLTIRPGCRLEFYNGGLIFQQNTTFSAIGTSADSISFISIDDGNSDTSYIGLLSFYYSSYCTMRNCIIENGRVGVFAGGTVTISNSTIKNCRKEGVVFTNYATIDTSSFQSNIVTSNNGYPISIYAFDAGKLSELCNFTGNMKSGIFVKGGVIRYSALWKNHKVPYIIDSCIDVSRNEGVTLTIAPGCHLEFTKNSYIQVGNSNSGTLIANGLENDSIFFSNAQGSVFWGYPLGGLIINQLATSSTSFRFCSISHATSGIYVDVPVTIRNCNFHDNRQYGIDFGSSGIDQSVTSNIFSNNLLGDIDL